MYGRHPILIVLQATKGESDCGIKHCSYCSFVRSQSHENHDMGDDSINSWTTFIRKCEDEKLKCPIAAKMSKKVSGSILKISSLCSLCQINSETTQETYQKTKCEPITTVVSMENLFVERKGHCKIHTKTKLLNIQVLADVPEFFILSTDKKKTMGVLFQSEISPLRLAVDMEDIVLQIPDARSSPFGLFYIGNPCYDDSFIGLKVDVLSMFTEEMLLLRFSDKENVKSRLSSNKWTISEVRSSKPYSTENTGRQK